MQHAQSVLAGLYFEQGMETEARSLRAVGGWETRRANAERQATPEEIEAFENRDLSLEYEPDQDDVPQDCWDETNNPN